MLSPLRRYRLPAALVAFSLLLSAFGPLAPCAMPTMEAGPMPEPVETAPCHAALDAPMAHPMPPSAPDGHDEAPCAEDACCAVRAPVAPRTETTPDGSTSTVLVLAAALAPSRPGPATAARPLPPPDGSPPSSVSRSILYGRFLT